MTDLITVSVEHLTLEAGKGASGGADGGAGLRDWAALGSAVMAAIAALAAWASVVQSRRLQLASVRPYLNGQLIQVGSGPINFAVQNAGAGPARGPGFCIIVGEEYVRGYAGPNMGGFFKPGDSRTVKTDFSGGQATEPIGVLCCWDTAGNFHVFDLATGKMRTWKRPRWWRRKLPSQRPEDALASMHPEVDLGPLSQVKGQGPKQMDAHR